MSNRVHEASGKRFHDLYLAHLMCAYKGEPMLHLREIIKVGHMVVIIQHFQSYYKPETHTIEPHCKDGVYFFIHPTIPNGEVILCNEGDVMTFEFEELGGN